MSIVLSREAWADGSAHRWLEERRTESGVIELGDGRWAVVSHRAAMEVLTDAKRFTSRFGTGPHHVEFSGRSVNLSDPPTPRKTLSPSPATGMVGVRVNQLAEELLNQHPANFVTDFAQPLALKVFGELFEVKDPAELNELGSLTRALPRAPDVQAFARADAQLLDFLRERPKLLAGASELTGLDRLYLQRLLAQTGHESTAMAVALSLELLINADLPFDDSPRAVDELLRLTSPLIRFGREATTRTSVNGIELPAGARVLVFFPLVNRDPAVFDEPHRIDLARAKNPHLSFGAGPHACFGADVARSVLAAALRAMRTVARPTRATSTPLISAVTRGLETLRMSHHPG